MPMNRDNDSNNDILIVRETLTDGSHVYNVRLTVGDYPNTRQLTIGTISAHHADEIRKALLDGASFYELD